MVRFLNLSTSETYEGVGLEIVDAHGDTDRFLKFRTNPSEFTVQTDQFFLVKKDNLLVVVMETLLLVHLTFS